MKKLLIFIIVWTLGLTAFGQTYTTVLQGQIFPANPNLSVANLTVRVYPDSLANPGFQPFTLQSDAAGMVYDTLSLTGSGIVKVDLIGCNGLPGNAFVLPVSPATPLAPFAFLYFCQPNPSNCVASFTVTPDTLFNLPGVFFFNSTSTQVGPNTQYLWDFGDGNLGNGPNITHVYNVPGVYLAHLYLTDPAGCSATASQAVVVNNSPGTGFCHAFFTYSGAPASSAPATVTFQNHSAFNPQSTFQWSFGDGSSSTLENPVHTYNTAGVFVVSLTQTDTSSNCTSTVTDTVYIGQPVGLCSVSFTATVDPLSPNVIEFRSLPVTSGGSIQYNWDFGTGGSVNQDNPNVYLPNGTYNVCLTISTARGCVATFCDTVVVNGGGGPGCDADFFYQAAANNQPLDIDFFNASPFIPGQFAIDSIVWDFGDGSPVVTQNSFPTHSFPAFGAYNVCMTIYTANCTDVACKTVTLLPNINTPTNKLLGTVLGIPPTPGNQVSVVLFELVNQNWQVRDSFLTVVPGLYLYAFDSLPAGVYSVRAELSPSSPDFLNYFPTYLGNTISWNSATGIVLGPQNPIGLTAIFMVPNNNPGNGGGNIIGNVGMANGFRTSQVARLDAMRVQLLDPAGQPLITAQVSANGNYSFRKLPYGTYLVHVDWPGMPCVPYSVTLSPDQPTLNGLNFRMSANGIEAIVSANATNTKVYPNPMGERLTVDKLVDEAGTYEVVITDLAGRVVMRQNHELIAGNQSIEVQTHSLSAGCYLLYVNSPNQQSEYFKLIK